MTPANDTPTPFGEMLFQIAREAHEFGERFERMAERARHAARIEHPLARSAEPSACERPGTTEGAVISPAAPSNYQKEAAR